MLCSYTQIREFLGSGSAREYCRFANISEIRINLPSLDEQHRVAQIHKTIQERIATLKQLNDKLDATGRALVERTFDKDVSIPLGSLMKLGNGFAFKSGSYVDSGQYKILTIGNVQDGDVDCVGSNTIDAIPQNLQEHCRLSIGDAVLSLTGNVGRVGVVVEDNCLLNQRVAVLLPANPAHYAALYFWLRLPTTQSQLVGISKGTAQANLSPVETLRLLVPFNAKTLDSISAQTASLYHSIIVAKREIRLLTTISTNILNMLG